MNNQNTSRPLLKTNHMDTLVKASSGTRNLRNSKSRLFTALLFCFIFFFLLVILLLGTSVYNHTNAQRIESNQSRLGLSLFVNSVKMNDRADAFQSGRGPEGASLVFVETLETGTYETRIYSYKGFIVEEYSIAEEPYTPDRAQQIIESEKFTFGYSENLLSIETDFGQTTVALRSVGGDAS